MSFTTEEPTVEKQLQVHYKQSQQQQQQVAIIARHVSITQQVLKARNSEHELQGLQVSVNYSINIFFSFETSFPFKRSQTSHSLLHQLFSTPVA